MNRNVFEALNATPDGGAPKNPFDLHNFEWLTSKAGQLLPVGCREVVPDGTYDLSVDAYTMTFPCNTASQADMKENYYFLFVPYYLLCRSAYSFFPQRKDNHSSLDYQIEQMPWFPLGDVVARCVEKVATDEFLGNGGMHGAGSTQDDVHGFSIFAGALRLLDLLGYGCYLDCVEKAVALQQSGQSITPFIAKLKENLNQYKPNVLRIAAYQKAWYCYFRNSTYDNAINPKAFSFDDVVLSANTTYNVLDYRSVDTFISLSLQMRYVQNKKDVVSASMPGTQFGAVSGIPLSIDLSNLGGTFTGTPVTPQFTGNTASVFGHTTTDEAKHSIYRKASSGSYVVANDAQISEYLDPNGNNHYTPFFKNDSNSAAHSTGIALSPKQVVDNIPMYFLTEPVSPNPMMLDLHSHDVSLNVPVTGNVSTITPQGTIRITGQGQQTSLFDVLQLTEAQAIQKWRQKSMLAGQKSKDQWRAHYGVVPDHMQDDYPDFIGSVDNVIHISQVVSQANTMSDENVSNLGDIAGRGYGASDNKKFRFHSKDYGVILLLRAVVSENVYSSYGLDRANQLIYYNDFWQPEFQNIGLEAVPKTLIQGFKPAAEVDPTGEGGQAVLPSNSSIIGYAPRNYQLKMYRSRVHGLFNPSRFTDFSSILVPDVPFGFGELEAFVQLRRDVLQKLIYDASENVLTVGNVPISLSTLYVNPAVTNSTFSFDADAFEDSDTFITKHRFNCDSVQPLSTLGLPQF